MTNRELLEHIKAFNADEARNLRETAERRAEKAVSPAGYQQAAELMTRAHERHKVIAELNIMLAAVEGE